MRIAAFFHQQQPQVGFVSDDLQEVTPFDMPLAQRELGALPLVEMLAAGQKLPPSLAALPLSAVSLRAPFPSV